MSVHDSVTLDFKYFDAFNENYNVFSFEDVPINGIFRYDKTWYKKIMPSLAGEFYAGRPFYKTFERNKFVLWISNDNIAQYFISKYKLNQVK